MNPVERRLWGKLYGLPDEDVARKELRVERVKIAKAKQLPKIVQRKTEGGEILKADDKQEVTENKTEQKQPLPQVTERVYLPRLRWNEIMGEKKN